MTAVDVLPDVSRLAVEWLLTQTDLTSLVGTRVWTRSPGPPLTRPYVTLQRIGGIPSVRNRLDSARVQVNAWGDTEGSASRVARVARASIHRMEGYVSTTAGHASVCTGVDDDLGLSPVPDINPNVVHMLFGVVIHAHSIP